MRARISAIFAVLIALAMGLPGAIGTANAAPLSIANPQAGAARGPVQMVQYREYRYREYRDGPRWHHRRHWGHHPRWDRRWHHRRHYRRHWRHHRHYRPYYGWGWYTPRYYRPRYYHRRPAGNAHTRWCYNRYRSYRAYDNTYQPYNGPRRQCYSPYI